MRAELRLDFARAGARTEAARAFETGGWRLRFPRARRALRGGGRQHRRRHGRRRPGRRSRVRRAPGAAALVTSQSQEKIYRADGAACALATRLDVAAGARLIWAPQETLLFEGARLRAPAGGRRRTRPATLTIFEAVAFGRLAHGETRVDAELADRWRLRRGGRLVFAEALRIADAGATLDRIAVGAGARALATLVRIGPDAADRLDPLRERLRGARGAAAASRPAPASSTACWSARMLSPSPQRLRQGLIAAWGALEGQDAPRVWY